MACWIRCQEDPYEVNPVLVDLSTGNSMYIINTNKIPRVVISTDEGDTILYEGTLANCINLVSVLGQELWVRGFGVPDVSTMLQTGREIAKEKEAANDRATG